VEAAERGQGQGQGQQWGVGDAESWVAVRECLVQSLPTSASNHALSSEALLLLAAVAAAGLAGGALQPALLAHSVLVCPYALAASSSLARALVPVPAQLGHL
jgi:hypothetical protein